MIITRYFFREFFSANKMFAFSLSLLCATHAILYAYKKMEGFRIPAHFCFLFFSADISRSVPFILNLSFALALVTWRYYHKLKGHDIAALISGFKAFRYSLFMNISALVTFSLNALALFWAHPALNYKIETQLYPKLIEQTLMALPSQQAFKLDNEHFIYFDNFQENKIHQKELLQVQLLNFDQDQRPYLISAEKGIFQEDKGSLLLERGSITPLKTEEEGRSHQLHFKAMDYKIKPSHVDLSAESLGARQLLFSGEASYQALFFWKIFLSSLPFLFVYVFSHSPIQLKFQAPLNYSIALATAFFLMSMIIGVIAMKAVAQGNLGTIAVVLIALCFIATLIKKIYIYVS